MIWICLVFVISIAIMVGLLFRLVNEVDRLSDLVDWLMIENKELREGRRDAS